jgi:hypothetical protein
MHHLQSKCCHAYCSISVLLSPYILAEYKPRERYGEQFLLNFDQIFDDTRFSGNLHVVPNFTQLCSLYLLHYNILGRYRIVYCCIPRVNSGDGDVEYASDLVKDRLLVNSFVLSVDISHKIHGCNLRSSCPVGGACVRIRDACNRDRAIVHD